MTYIGVDNDEETQSLTSDDASEGAGGTDTTTRPTSPVSDETERLPLDVIFDLLSNERRRRALRYLVENGPEATLSELAEHIASMENDKSVAAITSSERKRVYVGLYQSHLPKMADAGVINYNQARGTVELNAAADQLLAYLPDSPGGPDRADSWLQRLVPATLLTVGARLHRVNPGRMRSQP